GGAVEAFAYRAVVRRPGRDPQVADAFGGEVRAEALGEVLGAVVGRHRTHARAEAAVAAHDVVEEADRVGGGDRAQHDHHDRPAGRGVDGGELVHLANALQVPDVEAVDRDQVTGCGGVVAEPERFRFAGRFGDQPGRR